MNRELTAARSYPPHSPWLGVESGIDPLKLAKVLRQAHSKALRDGEPPALLRPLVAESWRRAAEGGVDPAGRPPLQLDDGQAERRLAAHPVAGFLPEVRKMLFAATDGARCFVALSDEEGVLLWVDGHASALETAAQLGFVPGRLCSESAVGTNAVGTALELGHAVQIFAAEHFSRNLHALTCVAAPIHDPDTGRTIAVLNLSGDFRTGHPHSLSLVSALVSAVEGMLAQERARRENALKAHYIDIVAEGRLGRSALVGSGGRVLAASPSGWLGPRVATDRDGAPRLPDGVEIGPRLVGEQAFAHVVFAAASPRARRLPALSLEAIGRDRIRISSEGWSFELAGRRGEIVSLLALHSDGLTAEELSSMLAGDPAVKPGSVRAEVSRLRRLLGPIVSTAPYRLDATVELSGADAAQMQRRR